MSIIIEELLKTMIDRGASDLHLSSGAPPMLRIDEKLFETKYERLTQESCKKLIYGLLSSSQIEKFEKTFELDMAFGLVGLSRFRVNVFMQRGAVHAAIRAIPHKIMTFEECGLPSKIVTELSRKPKGLVLVTGATGTGKSTTLASIIEKINQERSCHIITIEDPIEYTYRNKMAIVDQREVGIDTTSFSQALKHVLRQDPNVIMIGEMRDLETIETALIVAETGHLVFATLHTSDAVQTINRVIDVFPSSQQQQVRTQLSFVLLGILSQQLIPKTEGSGRVMAIEVMIATNAIRSLIRESKGHQIYSVIQTSLKDGMKTMNQSLYELCMDRKITYDEALARTNDPEDFERLFRKS